MIDCSFLGKGSIVIDSEENEECLVSKKRPRPSLIKNDEPSDPMTPKINKKQMIDAAQTSGKRKKRTKVT